MRPPSSTDAQVVQANQVCTSRDSGQAGVTTDQGGELDAPPNAAARTVHVALSANAMLRLLRLGFLLGFQEVCPTRALTLQLAPLRLRGALHTALRTGLRLDTSLATPDDRLRGWKLFLLAPRMLLYCAAGESHVAMAEFDRRAELFRHGSWQEFLHEASAAAGGAGSCRNAEVLQNHLCTLARAGPRLLLAAGTQATLDELHDLQRRPPTPYGPFSTATCLHRTDEF